LLVLWMLTSSASGFSLQLQRWRQTNNIRKEFSRSLASSPSTTIGADSSSLAAPPTITTKRYEDQLGPMASFLTKIGMISFIASMCIALPVTIFPLWALWKVGLLSRVRKEQYALKTGQFCARWLMRLIPFCRVEVTPFLDPSPEPSIWACNHASGLDIFVMLAYDLQARGKNKRPIKIVYWKQLEDNPVTKLLFQQSGFIPVQMAANKAGDSNDYDMKSFKQLLKDAKRAFDEGFDVGILPEGQLNPHPEEGMLPCFPGAFTLARMSKRPIQFMALQGTHRLWHADDSIGMACTGRDIKLRVFPSARKYSSAEEFLETFEAVVGSFGTNGYDVGAYHNFSGGKNSILNAWLDGSKWKEKQAAKDKSKEKEDDDSSDDKK